MSTLSYIDEATDQYPHLPIGYTCTDKQGTELGKIDGAVINGTTDRVAYLVLKTGGIFSHHRYVIPADQLREQDDEGRHLTLATISKQALDEGRLPEYDAGWLDAHSSAEIDKTTETVHPDAQHLQLNEERLRVGAESYQAGTVRLSKHVVERQETVAVTLREEYLRLEFNAREGTIRIGDRELAAGETFDIPLFKERAVVSKEVALSEGVTVHKDAVEHTEQVHGTVRREELVVEQGSEFVVGDATQATTAAGYTPDIARPHVESHREETPPTRSRTKE